MISEKTMMTWLAEFNKAGSDSDDGAKTLEWMVKMQGAMIEAEPNLVAMLSQLYSNLKIENPLSGALLALAIYHDCERRQKESDALSKDLKD